MKILGYKRDNGMIGIRNHLLVLSAVICANDVAREIASQLKGAVYVTHESGCGPVTDDDRQRVHDTLVGFGSNPNVGACIVVGLGCEDTSAEEVEKEISKNVNLTSCINIQKLKGTTNAIAEGVKIGQEMLRKISEIEKVECDISDIIMGLECGGSDTASGISANPGIGVASDILVNYGGTSILGETCEHMGGEHLLAQRAVNEKVKEDLLGIINKWEEMARRDHTELTNLSAGNIDGGLCTSEEKSLGCMLKGGNSPLQEVVEYAKRPSKKGFVVMDTPGSDIESITGMVAGGAQIIVFSTGRGTPTGCPIAPVIKVSSNSTTYNNMKENMDINAGQVIDGEISVAELGEEIFAEIVAVCRGKQTKAEALGFGNFSIMRHSFTS